MTSYRKASVRELATAAYELDAGVLQGRLERGGQVGVWTVGDTNLTDWLARYGGQEIILIAASLEDPRPLEPRICHTCGTDYFGAECPRCREARIRLRGR